MELPIYLIGYMGAGKTTIGRIVAERLGWHFVDLDAAFAEIYGTSTADFIRSYGIAEFRRRENDCVERLSELPIQKVIYATGGGYPCWEDNMDCLLELGTSIYLRWDNRHLSDRLWLTDLRERPVLEAKTKEELDKFVAWQMSAREAFYSRANYTINVAELIGKDISEEDDAMVAASVCELIGSLIKDQKERK